MLGIQTTKLVNNMASMQGASRYMVKLSKNIEANTASNLVERQNMMDSINVQVFSAEEVQSAAASSFMKRSGSLGSLSSYFKSGDSTEESSHKELMQIIATSGRHTPGVDENVLKGIVKSRENIIDSGGGRKTSLVKIDLESCGNPPYNPGGEFQLK